MRADALPPLIREARTAPLKARLERVEEELDALVAERERILAEEPPQVPAGVRGTVTPQMMRSRTLGAVGRREQEASRERRSLLMRIADIESADAD